MQDAQREAHGQLVQADGEGRQQELPPLDRWSLVIIVIIRQGFSNRQDADEDQEGSGPVVGPDAHNAAQTRTDDEPDDGHQALEKREGEADAPPAVAGQPRQSSVTEPDNLTFSVTEDKASAAVGEPVTLHVTLSNNTASAITGTFASDANDFTTLGPLLFNNSVIQDAEGHYISTNGSTDIPASKMYNVPVALMPGRSLTATLVYTFTRTDTYTVSQAVANLRYPTYAPPSYKSADPLTITVHT